VLRVTSKTKREVCLDDEKLAADRSATGADSLRSASAAVGDASGLKNVPAGGNLDLTEPSIWRISVYTAGESGGFCEVREAMMLTCRDADVIEAGLNEGAGSFASMGKALCRDARHSEIACSRGFRVRQPRHVCGTQPCRNYLLRVQWHDRGTAASAARHEIREGGRAFALLPPSMGVRGKPFRSMAESG
jgi:hypothetical protein